MRKLLGQFLRFGVVGLGGLVIDVTVFNLLRLTILSPDVLHEGPVIAKIVSTSLAIGANWVGNRRWTFATAGRNGAAREGVEFAIVIAAGRQHRDERYRTRAWRGLSLRALSLVGF